MNKQMSQRYGFLRSGFTKSFCWILLTTVVLGSVSCDCDKKTCRRLELALNTFINRAQGCCVLQSDQEKSDCFAAINADQQEVTSLLIALDAACDSDDHELIDRLLDQLEELVGNQVVFATGKPENTLTVMFDDELASVNMMWGFENTRIKQVNMVSDGMFTMLAEAAGNAAIESGSELVLITADETALEVESWRIQSGSSMSTQIGLGQFDIAITGSIQYTTEEIATPGGLGHLLTSAKLLASWEGGSIRFALDKTCQWNRVSDYAIECALIPLATDPTIAVDVALYPRVWIELPFVPNGVTSKGTTTNGWVSGSSLFPSSLSVNVEPCDEPVGSDGTIDLDWACQDNDGDGTANYAQWLKCRMEEQLGSLCTN